MLYLSFLENSSPGYQVKMAVNSGFLKQYLLNHHFPHCCYFHYFPALPFLPLKQNVNKHDKIIFTLMWQLTGRNTSTFKLRRKAVSLMDTPSHIHWYCKVFVLLTKSPKVNRCTLTSCNKRFCESFMVSHLVVSEELLTQNGYPYQGLHSAQAKKQNVPRLK